MLLLTLLFERVDGLEVAYLCLDFRFEHLVVRETHHTDPLDLFVGFPDDLVLCRSFCPSTTPFPAHYLIQTLMKS